MNEAAQSLLSKIIDEINPKEWKSYKTYLAGAGFVPGDLDEVDAVRALIASGIFTQKGEYDILDAKPLYLSEDYFDRMNPSEIDEVEEEIRDEQRNAEFGSW